MAATPEQVKEVMRNYIKAWSEGDRALLLSLFAEDATWEDPVGSPPFHGLEGIARFWDFGHQAGAQELNPELVQLIACGNEGILRFIMRVRLPAENKGLDLHAVDHFVINDQGKIQKARAFWDEGCLEVPAGMEMLVPDMGDMYEQ